MYSCHLPTHTPDTFRDFLLNHGGLKEVSKIPDQPNPRRFIRLNPQAGIWSLNDLSREDRLDDLRSVTWLPPWMMCFSIPASTRLVDLVPYKNKEIFGIDAASLAAVFCLDCHPDHDCLDLCCAPGSKMFAIAAQTNRPVVGVDVSGTRLGVCHKLAQAYGVRNCVLLEADGTLFDPSNPETYSVFERLNRRKSKAIIASPKPVELPDLYDRVLVDAECTHDGSVRHMKKFDKQFGWNTFERRVMDPARLEGLFDLQLGLLKSGWRRLKPGGRLVYSTCSLCPRQNQEVITAFLKTVDDAILPSLPFALTSDGRDIPGSKLVPALSIEINGNRLAACLFHPDLAGTSGLFLCVLEKDVGVLTHRTQGSDI